MPGDSSWPPDVFVNWTQEASEVVLKLKSELKNPGSCFLGRECQPDFSQLSIQAQKQKKRKNSGTQSFGFFHCYLKSWLCLQADISRTFAHQQSVSSKQGVLLRVEPQNKQIHSAAENLKNLLSLLA